MSVASHGNPGGTTRPLAVSSPRLHAKASAPDAAAAIASSPRMPRQIAVTDAPSISRSQSAVRCSRASSASATIAATGAARATRTSTTTTGVS